MQSSTNIRDQVTFAHHLNEFDLIDHHFVKSGQTAGYNIIGHVPLPRNYETTARDGATLKTNLTDVQSLE